MTTTPMVDASIYRVEKFELKLKDDPLVEYDLARRLEQMCGKLAEAVNKLVIVNDYCHCDNCMTGREALTAWEQMRKECGG